MKSSIVKRSVVIRGHKTSVSLEEPFWTDRKKSRMPSMLHCRHWSLRSTARANRAIYPRRSACLFFTTSVWPSGPDTGSRANATSFSGGLVVNRPRLCPPAS